MTRMERAALRHVQEELAYRDSAQAQLDRLIDRQLRAMADIRNGHVPACGLNRCAPNCPKGGSR
jgi:hypothetical protein